MYAVVATGGKQYRVEEGQKLKVERLGQPGDEVVMAAAGSRDLRAQGDVAAMGRLLSQRVGAPVRIGFVIPAVDGSGYPPVADVVAAARAQSRPGSRVAVAAYLLADRKSVV